MFVVVNSVVMCCLVVLFIVCVCFSIVLFGWLLSGCLCSIVCVVYALGGGPVELYLVLLVVCVSLWLLCLVIYKCCLCCWGCCYYL